MKFDYENIKAHLSFKTARSGGKGGQHVNKVESKVIAYLYIDDMDVNSYYKEKIYDKLKNNINKDGYLIVQSENHKSQLMNKNEVIEKIISWLNYSTKEYKKRKPSKPSKKSKEKHKQKKIEYKQKKQIRKNNKIL